MSDAVGRRTVRHLVAASAAGAVLITGVISSVHVLDQHRAYGVWSWSPTGATPRLPFEGRHYQRAGPSTEADLAGFVRLGTASGGEIWGPPTSGNVPTGIVLRLDRSLTSYSLSGGP